jgi:hypothetical protein
LAKFTLGVDFDPEEALRLFNGRVIAVDNGEKWWLKSFVRFQYGSLNPQNKVHASVIKRLGSLGLADNHGISDVENVIESFKGLARGFQALKDMEQVLDQESEGGPGETKSDYPTKEFLQHKIASQNSGSLQSISEMRKQYLEDSNQQLLLYKLLAARGGENERLSRETLDTWIDVFITTLETEGKPLPNNYGHFSDYFRNWMKYNYRKPPVGYTRKEETPDPYVVRALKKRQNGQG